MSRNGDGKNGITGDSATTFVAGIDFYKDERPTSNIERSTLNKEFCHF
jgi:hypothetical protein